MSQLSEALSGDQNDVVSCTSTNDFFEGLSEHPADVVVVDTETWNNGESIYSYFGMGKKLETIPFVFYNADEGFSGIRNRVGHEKDRTLERPTEIGAVIDTVKNM